MTNWLTGLAAALFIGILLGVLMMWDGGSPAPTTRSPEFQADVAARITPDPDMERRIARLESDMASLREQLRKLRNNPAEQHTEQAGTAEEDDKKPADKSDPLNEQNLVAAGVSPGLAADIMYRSSELEYKKLALRDRAIREDYYRSRQYFHELRQLNEQQLSLRDEIGDAAYDRYLYQTGQNNRVEVSSVMAGSPAQQNGVQKGDIVLRYNGKSVYSWDEIRRETSQGQLGEYVNLEILRDGSTINLTLPRGPLGVKLNPLHQAPESSR